MGWRKNFCYWLIVTCEVHRVRAAGADGQLVIAKPANGTEKKTCRPPGVIVVGVSRSGTSIATSILGRLGAHLGHVAKGSYQNHPDGKNEFKPAVVVNKHIYDVDGLTWDELPRPLSPGTRTRRDLVDRAVDALVALLAVWKSTFGLGGPHQTSELSISVTSKSIRLIFGRIDCSRRILEARQKASRRNRSITRT